MRRNFLALFGLLPLAAKGQTSWTCAASDPKVCEEIAKRERARLYTPKPRNGECPVCGTVVPSMTQGLNLRRCLHCQAAFFVYAE